MNRFDSSGQCRILFIWRSFQSLRSSAGPGEAEIGGMFDQAGVSTCVSFLVFFSDQFEAHLCVLLHGKWIFSSRIPHSTVCMFTQSFQCVVGRQNTLRTDLCFSSGFAFSPGFRPETRR